MWKMRDMVINEVKVIEGIIDGDAIPSYYTTGCVVDRLFRYYKFEMNLSQDETLRKVVEVLERNKVIVSMSVLKQFLNSKEKITPLRKHEGEGIVLYKKEVDKILALKNIREQRIMFGMLIMQKVKNLNRKTSSNIFYDRWDEIFLYTGISGENLKNSILHSLHQQGYITVPLFEEGIIINVLAYNELDEEIVYVIDDADLTDYTKYFDRMIEDNKEYILEICVESGDCIVHDGGVRKVGATKGISPSNICKVLKLDKLTLNGSMFVKVNSTIAHSKDLQRKVKNYYMKMGSQYRKLKKRRGIAYILTVSNFFKLLIQHKIPNKLTVSVGKFEIKEPTVSLSIEITKRPRFL